MHRNCLEVRKVNNPFKKKKKQEQAVETPDGEESTGGEAAPKNKRKRKKEKKKFVLKLKFASLFGKKKKNAATEPGEEDAAPDAEPSEEPAADDVGEPAKQEKPKKEKKKKEKKPKKAKKEKKPKKAKAAEGEDKGKGKKKLVIIVAAVGALVAAGITVAVFALGGEPPTPEELLAQAEQHIIDEKYDKAEKIYTQLIESEQMVAEAHLGIADSRLSQELGLEQEAVAVLEEGFALTQDERIALKLEELGAETEGLEPVLTDNPIVWQDKAMEEMIRMALGKPSPQPVTEGDMRSIKRLKIMGATHAVADESLNALNTVEGYTVEGILHTERGSIRSLADLAHCSNLKKLTVGYNQVSDLSGIQKLTGLETLSLYFNDLTNVADLENLTELKYLFLYNNAIDSLSGLEELTNLRSLYLQNNQVEDLSPLDGLTQLRELYIGNNRVSDLSAVASMENLGFLQAANNQIADITPLQGLSSLTDISFQGNPVTDYKPAESVQNVNKKL